MNWPANWSAAFGPIFFRSATIAIDNPVLMATSGKQSGPC